MRQRLPQSGALASSDARKRKRRRRPAWSLQEERTLVQQHVLHGNTWLTIAQSLPGRSAGEIKNIYNSTLRSRRTRKRSLLRTYIRALDGQEQDVGARRRALQAAEAAYERLQQQQQQQQLRHQQTRRQEPQPRQGEQSGSSSSSSSSSGGSGSDSGGEDADEVSPQAAALVAAGTSGGAAGLGRVDSGVEWPGGAALTAAHIPSSPGVDRLNRQARAREQHPPPHRRCRRRRRNFADEGPPPRPSTSESWSADDGDDEELAPEELSLSAAEGGGGDLLLHTGLPHIALGAAPTDEGNDNDRRLLPAVHLPPQPAAERAGSSLWGQVQTAQPLLPSYSSLPLQQSLAYLTSPLLLPYQPPPRLETSAASAQPVFGFPSMHTELRAIAADHPHRRPLLHGRVEATPTAPRLPPSGPRQQHAAGHPSPTADTTTAAARSSAAAAAAAVADTLAGGVAADFTFPLLAPVHIPVTGIASGDPFVPHTTPRVGRIGSQSAGAELAELVDDDSVNVAAPAPAPGPACMPQQAPVVPVPAADRLPQQPETTASNTALLDMLFYLYDNGGQQGLQGGDWPPADAGDG